MPAHSKRIKEREELILARLRIGVPLVAAAREAGISSDTFRNWCDADEALAIAYARAREAGEDVIAQEALEIWDETPARYATEHGTRVDPAFVQHQRNRAEGRLKLLAKWNPKRWGDKIDHGGSVGLVVTVASDVAGVG